MTTLLERAKGSALDITIRNPPLRVITRLSPYTGQIKRLNFPYHRPTDILTFHHLLSGPLPLLHTLEIYMRFSDRQDEDNSPNPPSSPLFGGAINLKELILDLRWGGSLNHFLFPNLTTFKLLAPKMDRLNASYLFDFLRASPTLRTVGLTINGGTIPGSIPKDMVIVLPNVETFSLTVDGNISDAYEPAVHISCPRAKHTSLTHEVCDSDIASDPRDSPIPLRGWQSPASTQQVRSRKSRSRWIVISPRPSSHIPSLSGPPTPLSSNLVSKLPTSGDRGKPDMSLRPR